MKQCDPGQFPLQQAWQVQHFHAGSGHCSASLAASAGPADGGEEGICEVWAVKVHPAWMSTFLACCSESLQRLTHLDQLGHSLQLKKSRALHYLAVPPALQVM